MKAHGKAIVASLCILAMLASISLITPTYARYSNSASTAVVYGGKHTEDTQTLSADTKVYDFGIYRVGTNITEFTHTLRITQSTAVAGMLRFEWDSTTRSSMDVAMYVDSSHYQSMQSSGYTDYTVSAPNGDLRFPFSLFFSTPASDRVAVLDVSWYPQGSDEPTLFARYLLAMDTGNTGSTAPAFVEGNTAFITDRFLKVAVTTPADCAGVKLAPAAGAFSTGTRYFNKTYSDGVTLLRDSALFIPRMSDSAELVLDLTAHLTDKNPLSLRVGVSDTLYSTLSRTPSTVALTVSKSSDVGILTASKPLTITLTEAAPLRDSNWSAVSGNSDLTWQLWRRVGDSLQPITVGKSLTVTATQTQSGGTLTIAVPGGAQPPGTYMLLINQYYCGYSILETPVWFFIDYR